MERVRQLRHFGRLSGELDWASDDDHQAIENVEFLKAGSEYIKEECDKYDLKYFENSTDHWQTIDAAVQYLSA